METSLPQPVRLRLGQTLAQWRRWQCAPVQAPETVEILTAGRSNTSVRVGDGERHWVVRIDRQDPRRLGLSREAEWRCLLMAADAGLAPRPVYRDLSLGTLVCEFHAPEPGPEEEVEKITVLLRAIHKLPAVRHRLDPLARARRYLALAGGSELPEALREACRRLEEDMPAPRLCHNDLLRSNRLYSRGVLLALDWEYAAMGDPLFDLAAIIEGDGFSEERARALHWAWRGRAPTATEAARLEDQRLVYRSLAALWEQIAAPPEQGRG
jgi:aminoglycoside phosphotransferase (APT) family kinase protein